MFGTNSYRRASKAAMETFKLAELKRDKSLYGLASDLFMESASNNRNPDSTLRELKLARYSAIRAGESERAHTIHGAILLEIMFRTQKGSKADSPENIELKDGQTLGEYIQLLNYAFKESSRLCGMGAYEEAENVLGKIASEILDDNSSVALLREVVKIRELHADTEYENGRFTEAIALYMSAARYAENIQYLDDANRIFLKVIEIRVSRAEILITLGEKTEALKDYEEAIAIANRIGEKSIAKTLSQKKDTLYRKK